MATDEIGEIGSRQGNSGRVSETLDRRVREIAPWRNRRVREIAPWRGSSGSFIWVKKGHKFTAI